MDKIGLVDSIAVLIEKIGLAGSIAVLVVSTTLLLSLLLLTVLIIRTPELLYDVLRIVAEVLIAVGLLGL